MTALLEHNHHLIHTGQILLADKGLAGTDFHHLTAARGLHLLRPDRKDETYRSGGPGGVRQWIESVNQTLKGQLDLEDHRTRTLTGMLTPAAQHLWPSPPGAGTTGPPTSPANDH